MSVKSLHLEMILFLQSRFSFFDGNNFSIVPNVKLKQILTLKKQDFNFDLV